MKPNCRSLAAIAAALLLLSACGGGSSNNGGSPDEGNDDADDVRTASVDASDGEAYTHLDLATGETVDDPAADPWHIAFRRYAVRLNGGASGDGNAVGALVAEQAHFYTEDGDPDANVFLNTSADDELDVLTAELDEPDDGDWVEDAITSAFADAWYVYDPATGMFDPEPANGWLVRSGSGEAHARVHMTELDFDSRAGNGVEHFRIEMDVQPEGIEQFSDGFTTAFEGSIPAGGGSECFDFEAEEAVDCTGTAWDLRIGFAGRSFFLRTNGGASGEGDGAAFGPVAWDELGEYQSGTIDADGNPVPAVAYEVDSSSGIFDEANWYAYNLSGEHQLWPNYRVYLIDTDGADDDAARYAVQITGYYDATGASGHPAIRWREVE